ncbi:hypothetical protein Y1Q_0004638 [Alligator mississippiensis]|uniref:Uncharacterized protein n=1 Tax=Alligator mississippiensis TaxID=8496 RepID=A0A151MHP0_ALLMI|nr:hypothetical protein Y1Q_0004638 [Alligator mississippiensis]
MPFWWCNFHEGPKNPRKRPQSGRDLGCFTHSTERGLKKKHSAKQEPDVDSSLVFLILSLPEKERVSQRSVRKKLQLMSVKGGT